MSAAFPYRWPHKISAVATTEPRAFSIATCTGAVPREQLSRDPQPDRSAVFSICVHRGDRETESLSTMSGAPNTEPIHLDLIRHEHFRSGIRRRVSAYHAHFSDRLAAVYVSGSVHRDEAVPGVSDLDMLYFIRDPFSEADEQWIRQIRQQFEEESPDLGGATRPRFVDEVLLRGSQPDADEDARIRARAWGTRLRYDATRVWGQDVLEGLAVPPPDRSWARLCFQSPWDLTRHAAGLEAENRTDFTLPEDPPLRLRKLARLGVLGGAWLLAAHGEFSSFRGSDVLPPLLQRFRHWSTFMSDTTRLYVQPVDATPAQVSRYLTELVPWMDWIGAGLAQGD
jgi:hypothetical protein